MLEKKTKEYFKVLNKNLPLSKDEKYIQEVISFSQKGTNRELFFLASIFLGNLYYDTGRINDCIQTFDNAIKTITDKDPLKTIFNINVRYALILANISQAENGLKLLKPFTIEENESLELMEMANYYQAKGACYSCLGYLDLALENSYEAYKIKEKIGDIAQIVNSIINLGNLYTDLHEFELAEKYFQKGVSISLKNKYPVWFCYMSLITLFLTAEKWKKAEDILKKVNKLALDKNHLLLDFSLQFYKAIVERELGRIQNSYEIFKLIKEKYINENLPDSLVFEFHKDFAITLKNIGKNKKAVKEFKKALKIKGISEHGFIATVNLELFKLYEKRNKTKKALKHLKKYNELFEENLKNSNKNAMAEMQVKFETAETEKKAEKHKTESLKFQLQSLRSQMNPHFVFNAISSISSHLKEDNIEHSKHLLNSFARLMRSNLEFAETEKISLEEEIKFLKDYLNLEKNRLANQFDFEIVFDKKMDFDFIEIPSMLLQPYVENAIKHGIMPLKKDGFIEIKFKEKEDILECTITDNGIGRKAAAKKQDNKEKHLGKSTKITETRLDLLNQKGKDLIKIQYFDFENRKGTKVLINIKL